MILADSGYLIALLRTADELHTRAVDWSRAITEAVVVNEYVLLETFNALSAPAFRRRLHDLYEQIRERPDIEFIEVDSGLHASALELHRSREDKSWSLTDCVSFVIMREMSISRALAHDSHFEQAGFQALLRRDP